MAKPIKNILVVDDEECMRDVLELMLVSAGYSVFLTENPKKVVELIGAHSIDLLITDVIMPQADGIETTLSARKAFPEIKIIAMSGAGDGSLYLSMISKLGAHGVIGKPFKQESLLNLIKRLDSA